MSSAQSSLSPRLASYVSILTAALVAASAGCEPPEIEPDEDSVAELREAWSQSDDPRLLDPSFTYVLDNLPESGVAAEMPWPGNYWPTAQDSINYRWAGPKSRSAAEKYGLAFGKANVEDAVSRYFGVDSLHGRSCKYSSDCNKGQSCARRRGEKTGRCAARWAGLCHAWAPASLLVPEPRKGVTYNGVRFEINDIKALVVASYTKGIQSKFMSLRCEETNKNKVTASKACRDTNAGSFHVAVANLLGLRGMGFIEDRNTDYEVWNFPVVAYRVTRNKRISPTTANELLGVGGSSYAFNKKAVELRRIQLELTFVGTSDPSVNGYLTDDVNHFLYTDTYNYILELDGSGRIIGGEWVGGSRLRHPDFLWVPVKKTGGTVAGVIDYNDVQHLLQLSGAK